MRINPRYHGPPVLRVDVCAGDPSVPLVRQRRRLADTLARLDAAQWAAPSRCQEWSVQDVVAHLVSTNEFWTASIAAGLSGKPTQILRSFDPAVTPAQLVDGLRSMTSSQILDRYVETVEALSQVVTGLDDEAWAALAEAPTGHIAVHAVSMHALWDAWIHERDIVLPLGGAPDVEDDEVGWSLRYVAALGPACLAASGSLRQGRLTVEASDPDVSFVVDAGPTVVVCEIPSAADGPRLTGGAVSLVEGLSHRARLEHHLDPADQWLVSGLGVVFGVAPVGVAPA